MSYQSSRPLWILGLNIGAHDASAALLRDGELIAMCEQERLSRRKRASGEAPVDAARYCLDHAGISLERVDAVAVGSDMARLNEWLGLSEAELASQPRLDHPQRLFPHQVFGCRRLPPLFPVRHHLAHAASAFWCSGFRNAAILVVDNRGEDSSTTLAYGEGDRIRTLEQHGVEVSLGLYYRIAAQFAGLCGEHREVGKLMGLAAYGSPNQSVALRWEGNRPMLEGLPGVDGMRGIEIPPHRTSQLLGYFSANCFPHAVGLSDEIMAYANFAASVQRALEETLLGLCRRLKHLTGCARLAMAGGVALNCSANGRVARSGLFEEIFIQPAAHDAGVALGAALELTRRLMPSGAAVSFQMKHAYWGPQYTQQDINTELERRGLRYRLLDEESLVAAVARLLAERKVIGWFQGRAEVGPRALGARSLLGNPSIRETLVRLNRIKGREMWRPLAPSVPAERLHEFFSAGAQSPFMLVAATVHPHQRRAIPAVVHVDGSSRPQAVTREANPRFWRLLNEFERLSGIPVIVNTSFNVANEPIVCSPRDAVNDFLATEIDALAIGDALVLKDSVGNSQAEQSR
jgi:carbamoyltransferase